MVFYGTGCRMKFVNGRRRRFSPLFTGSIYYTPVARNSPEWDVAKRLIEPISLANAHDMDNHRKYPFRLLKVGNCYNCYSIVFRAKGADRVTATYVAEVKLNSLGFYADTIYFNKIDGSETRERRKRSRNTRGKTETNDKACYSKEELSTSTPHKGSVEPVSVTPALVGEETSGNLSSRAFYRVVAEIRNQRPYLEYAKVRKLASCKWRTLSENEKKVYMDEAAKSLGK